MIGISIVRLCNFGAAMRRFVSFSGILLFFAACGPQTPDISSIQINLSVQRLDLDLNEAAKKGPDAFMAVLADHEEILPYYVYELIGIRTPPDSLYADLYAFFLEPDILELADSVRKAFPDEPLRATEEIQTAFRYLNYYMPEYPVPELVYFLFGFNYVAVPLEGRLYFALDQYLGPNSMFLAHLPLYMRVRRTPDYIAVDALKAWLTLEFQPEREDYETLLDHMIHQGRVHYVLNLLFPKMHDTLAFGFTAEELQFCKDNTFMMWGHVLEKNLLYENDPSTVQKLMGEAPFTPGMPKESPGRAFVYLGRDIVQRYMERRKEFDLYALFTERPKEILNQSNYRPKKP
jgi:hypothetical protein